MQNIGVACDITWDNYFLLNNKFKKINSEHYRINAIYGKTLEIIKNCCMNNNLTIIRHYSENLSKTIYNLLKICDIWLIFTNHIEYNTQTRLIIDKCNEYNIKYIIISEHSKKIDYYSFEYFKDLSFKKNLSYITKSRIDNIVEFDYKEINEINTRSNLIPLNLSPEIISKIKQKYVSINQHKKERSIKLLYDKDEIKREKQLKKTIKEVSQLNFNNNRRNYYKNIK